VLRERISREQAEAAARDHCEERGITCLEPVRARWRPQTWFVVTHHGHIGGNVFLVIDAKTGAVRSGGEGATPR